jgi:predicted dehydrogenase
MAIEIALLGCRHPDLADVLGVIVAEPDVRLAAAWDADPASIPGSVRTYAVADAETAIARADAVVVCAPAEERPVLCVRAARAGRPVLVPAPIAFDAAEAGRLARELGRSRTPVVPWLFLRELAALGRLRDALRAGVIGRVGAIEATLAAPPVRTPSREGHRRAFRDLAVHLLDALSFLGDQPRLDAVSLDLQSGGVDLGGAAVGRWGVVPLVVRASVATPGDGLRIAADGSRARAILSGGTLELRDADGDAQRWIGGPPDAGEAVRAFLERLRRRAFPRDGLAGVVRAQAIAERAHRFD